MKTIIAGSRNLKTNMAYLTKVINESGFTITEVVSGGARGIDKLGENWAIAHKVPFKIFYADWKNLDAPYAIIREGQYGKYNARAGFDRNEKMGDYADQLIAIWDGESPGTLSMINIMTNLNKPLHINTVIQAEPIIQQEAAPINKWIDNLAKQNKNNELKIESFVEKAKKHKLKVKKEENKFKRKISFD